MIEMLERTVAVATAATRAVPAAPQGSESLFGMSTAVVVALISALVALAGVVVNGYFTWRNAERQKEIASSNALTSYQFEARKRLYTECEPLLFQLSEACEQALRRCELLGTRKACERLSVQDTNPYGLHGFMLSRQTELIASAYELLHPLALFCLLREKMTRVDCSLDPVVSFQYRLVRHLYASFHDDEEIAAQHPQFDYEPRAEKWVSRRNELPQKYWWQGVTPGRLDRAVRMLTLVERDSRRVMTFGEFEDLYMSVYKSNDVARQKTLGVFANPLYGFTPDERPVFWRLLLVQAHIHQALTRPIPATIEKERRSPGTLRAYLNLARPERFNLGGDKGWTGTPGSADRTPDVALAYLADRLAG
ncbi:MAG: hypothetical protein ACJ8ER_02450 [Allosphingosinicella sp.]